MLKLDEDQFNTLIELSYKKDLNNLREGQRLMNFLHMINPTVYQNIVGTEFDCFYNDNLISAFWIRVSP